MLIVPSLFHRKSLYHLSLLTSFDALRILSDLASHHKANNANHATKNADSSDSERGSNCHVCTLFYDQGGSKSIRSTTKLTPEKFTGVWLVVAENAVRYWNIGRGRKSRVSSRDAVLILLTVLRHEQQLDFTARRFGVSKNTFKRLIVGSVNAVLGHTYELCVEHTEEKWKKFKWIRDTRTYRNFDYACCDTEMTFQHVCRSSDSVAKRKKEFFGKA